MNEEIVKNTPKLGFGLMRLPRRFGRTDIPQVEQMVDEFLEAGFTYFDTAHVYVGSEEAVGKALVRRHPRESFTLASKLYAPIAPTVASAHKQLVTTLKRTGAGYLDYYLLHSLSRSNYQKYEKFGLWDWVADQKANGTLRNVGFSFHSDHELLDQLLNEHPEVDFVQLQINYADWENDKIESRANYEVARGHHKPIVVMEPVKGGKLANPPREARKIFDEADIGMSYASWAIRYVASLPGILTVLSGMSDIHQMRDNISYMREFKPLDEDERATIRKVQKVMGLSNLVPCTSCRYCLTACPVQMPIPEVFEALNEQLEGHAEDARRAYADAIALRGVGPSDCVHCGNCDHYCTQNIDVMDELQRARAALE